MTDLSKMSLGAIADLVAQDWSRVYFGARPYLRAMMALSTMHDTYGKDDAETVVMYFLSNANGWRTDTARAVKAELRKRLSVHQHAKRRQARIERGVERLRGEQ